MPNSGTVTAGSVALASQYNNLRSDVLNVSTGHTHTGASENGAQIEGTVIKSTGATVGAVLTAGTGGTATTWTVLSGGAGALGSAQVNLVFGTGTLTETTYNSTNTGGAWWAVGCGGTKIMSVDRVVNTSARTIQVYNLDTAAAAASTALALTIAGTVQRVIPSSTGFTAGTAFVVQETIDATTSGARTTTVRKLNQSLTSNMWNTTVYNGISTTLKSALSQGAFYTTGCRYAATPGVYYSWDSWGSAATTGTATVFIINDSTGTLYSAPFATASSTTAAEIYFAQYVPPVSSGNGTIYAWGYTNAGGTYTALRIDYSVSGTSISAVATASSLTGYPGLGQGIIGGIERAAYAEYPLWGYYDDQDNYLLLNTKISGPSGSYNTTATWVTMTRDAGTVTSRSRLWDNELSNALPSVYWHYSSLGYDPKTKIAAARDSNYNYGFKFGKPSEFLLPLARIFKSTGFSAGSYMNATYLAGNGSATHWFFPSNANSTASKSTSFANDIVEVDLLGTASTGRIVYWDQTNSHISLPLTITADGAFPLNPGFGMPTREISTGLPVTGFSTGGDFPLYLPAGATLKATFSRNRFWGALDAAATNAMLGSTFAGTATFGIRTITLV